jgi:nucleotide-binding universal stress UspA family protein
LAEAEKRTTGLDEGRSGSDAKRYLLLIVTAGETSRRAGEVALWLAESLGLELRITAVTSPHVLVGPLDQLVRPSTAERGLAAPVPLPSGAEAREVLRVHELAEQVLLKAREAGVRAFYKPIKRAGDVLSGILAEAEEGCAMIVMGRGDEVGGAFGRLAQEVAKRSRVPVLLVP